MHVLKCLAIAIAAAVASVPSGAQTGGYDGDLFIKAIRDGNGSEALKLLREKPTLVNARDVDGETALIAAIANRDPEWTGHLINEGADPDLAGGDGDTPLMAAARVGFSEAAGWLVSVGAKIDATNRMGETALIIAVQRRQVPLVRLLVQAGADPDRADSAAGYSARDYAKRDSRTPEMLRIIEAKKPAG